MAGTEEIRAAPPPKSQVLSQVLSSCKRVGTVELALVAFVHAEQCSRTDCTPGFMKLSKIDIAGYSVSFLYVEINSELSLSPLCEGERL